MARANAKNDGLPAFSRESLEAFIAWLHVSRETIRSQKIASFLAVAQVGKLKAGATSPSANSENIRDLGRILGTTLAVPTGGGMVLTEDGQTLASLFCQFADFVAACHGKPYQWKIGGADTAIQWVVSPVIPRIYEEFAKSAIRVAPAGKQHQKPVRFFFRTGRTDALKADLLNSRIHFGVLRRGVISEALLRFSGEAAPKRRGVQLRADVLGKFDYRIYVNRPVVEAAKAKERGSGGRVWDYLPFAMVGHHRVALEGGGESGLESFFEDAALNIELRCETAIQAANMLKYGYAAVLASYFPKEHYGDVVEYGLDEFQISIPTQTLILVGPTSLLDYNPTARVAFDLLKKELQARLRS